MHRPSRRAILVVDGKDDVAPLSRVPPEACRAKVFTGGASGLPPILHHPFSDRVVRLVHAVVRGPMDGYGSVSASYLNAYTSPAVSNVLVTSTPKSHNSRRARRCRVVIKKNVLP